VRCYYCGTMTRQQVKTTARRVIQGYRQTSWRLRASPDFIIIGAQKSGTTTLYSCLGQHPQIFPPSRKEVHYFDGGRHPGTDNFERGEKWYRAHFPLRLSMRPGARTFEASPLYMLNPLVPERIFNALPEARLIAILRNPTDRAISHYFHEKRQGRESLPIMEAMQQEEQRLGAVVTAGNYNSAAFIHCSYKRRGLYRQQLEGFFRFFPRRQVLVLNSGEFFRKPDITLKKVFDFVGVDAGFRAKTTRQRNVGTNNSDVSLDVYDYLNDYFFLHNEALYELLGENYGW
jgi:hypothetical protein